MTVNHDDAPVEGGILPLPLKTDTLSNGSPNVDRERLRLALEGSFLLARAAMNQGDVQGAINCLDRVLQLDPDNLGVLIEKGLLFHRIGKAEDAVRCFQAARQIAPEDQLVLTNLAVALEDS